MANNLGGLVTKFTTRLDRVLEQSIKTGFLQINDAFLGDFVGVGEVKLPTFTIQGLGDYDRANGFVPGDTTIEWATYQLRYDRGREFSIDVMDDEEHLKIVTANAMAEFARTQVVPEVDAIRFAELAKGAGKVETPGAITTPEAALEAVLDMEEYFEDLGFDLSGLTLNLTSSMKTLLRKAQPWRIGQGETPNTKFETFDDMALNVIPTSRFYTAIELNDGKTEGEEDGGFKKATDGKALNFLIAAPGAATGITKHQTLRYFPPEVNQDKDAHKWQYRLFHDLLVYKQKKGLIYANVGV